MTKPLSITPTHKAVRAYYAALKAFEHQKVAQEQAVRAAFQHLLTDLAKPLHWTAIPEHGKKVRGKRIIPDGTLKDKYQLPRGYWEAKDTADDLDQEIRDKKAKGYPLTNTIFWTPTRAVLYQNGAVKHDLAIADRNGQPGAFCDLLTEFFTYVDAPLLDFDDAVSEFEARIPEVGRKLAEIIAAEHARRGQFEKAFTAFFELCKTTLNPNISREAVDEMLVQHLLTVRLFKSVFRNPEFLRKNVIAVEVEKVIDALARRSFNREEFLASLDRFYVAIENAAERAPDWSSKQAFLNTVYERFFQGYCVKTADTHGIVYTPQPIVDFMCASVEWVLEHEFGKKLGDDGVNILDPCTGTGNFVVNLMRRAAEHGTKRLKRMYAEQLFANEIMLMPYYIAALNIEHEYFDHVGEYEAFEGLCFVDTLDLAEPKTLGLFNEANLARVERQKKSPITVVIGNPPYYSGQKDALDNNQKRSYPVIDARIRSTYARKSKAKLLRALYDPYVRFLRWATDRLGERDGIVCMVTNNAFAHQHAFDSMRRHLARDFSALYHADLRGNVRHDPTLSGSAYNVFGIQVGVGITIAVRSGGRRPAKVLIGALNKTLSRFDKLGALDAAGSAENWKWTEIDASGGEAWESPQESDHFSSLVPIVAEKSNASDSPRSLFVVYSNGSKTNADDYVLDFSTHALTTRSLLAVEDFNGELDRWRRCGRPSELEGFLRVTRGVHKWIRATRRELLRDRDQSFDAQAIVESLYRPFSKRMHFTNRAFNEDLYQIPRYFISPLREAQMAILVSAVGSERPFYALATRHPPNLSIAGFGGACQVIPLLRVTQDERSVSNASTWALDLIRRHFTYPDDPVAPTEVDLFHYVYSMLHHPGYRETFAENLKRELPRIPLAATLADFRAFVKTGEALAKLHLHYDDETIVKPHPLKEVWAAAPKNERGKRKDYRIADKMKLSKDKDSLRMNDSLTLVGIPPEVFRYRLGNRSALEWVIDQYQVTTDKKTGQVSDCNAWGEERDDPEYVVRLVKQVVTVSLETMKLVDALPKDFGGPPRVKLDTGPAPSAKASAPDPGGKPPKFELRGDDHPKQGRLRPRP